MKTFWNWLLGKERTVESIIAGYAKTVEDLVVHSEQKLIEVAKEEETAAIAKAKAVEAQLEADKAKLLATKIGDLISG